MKRDRVTFFNSAETRNTPHHHYGGVNCVDGRFFGIEVAYRDDIQAVLVYIPESQLYTWLHKSDVEVCSRSWEDVPIFYHHRFPVKDYEAFGLTILEWLPFLGRYNSNFAPVPYYLVEHFGDLRAYSEPRLLRFLGGNEK